MATRRQGLKRIKKRPLSERSEFRTLPVSVPGGACSPCEARTAIVGAAFFAPLFWRSKKAGRPPGRTPGYSPRQCIGHASSVLMAQQWRLALALRSRCAQLQLRLRGCSFLADDATRLVLPDDQAGGRPGSRVTSRSNAKRSNQEKATPMMAVR